jgi:hypothetical protein
VGRLGQDLTRDYSTSADTVFHRRALETLRRWRFKPGVRKGKAVRSAFELTIESNQRNDTLPARLEWRYTTGAGAEPDKLLGTWVVEPALPKFSTERVDSIHTAVIRQLVRMGVLQPGDGRHYCLIMPGSDSAAHEHTVALAQRTNPSLASRATLASGACQRVPGTLRVALPDMHRTENGRTVVNVSGDYLPHWPSGLDGRPWRSWQARCVAQVSEQRGKSVAMSCDVVPGEQPDEMRKWAATPQGAQQEFTTFLLGDVGDRATAPITLCFENCARSYVLDPARHTLAAQAHLIFRLADLRPDTRLGAQLLFRIAIDPAPSNLLPLVIVKSGEGLPSLVWIAKPADPGTWDHSVFNTYPPDAEVHLYLIAR